MHHLPAGTVTSLFTDIEGSTRLLQQLGDRYAEVLMEYRHVLRAACQRWHGHEVDTQGDAFFVAFVRALDAIAAAVDAQRTLVAHTWPEGATVRVRMGLHTGEPFVAAEGYVGMDVHYAARLMSAGYGGQVLLSQTSRDLVEHDLPEGVSLRNLGEYRFKDVGYSSHVFQLVIAGLSADFPPLRTLSTLSSYPNNLPIMPTPLIGREQEIAAVQQLLCSQDVRLLTLTGPGGTGKTRLGVRVAAQLRDQFPDGVFFVALAAVSDADLLLPTLAQVLGIQEGGSQPLLEGLKEYLQQKKALLLLDNFEQVLPAALPVESLLMACPHIKVLVTSRAVLHLQTEHIFSVPPLALPDMTHLPHSRALEQFASVALFVQRAQAMQPAFQVTQANARAIAEICVRLDGLPLAIELAAARIRLLPPQALLARLSNSLRVLTGGSQTLPDRQQTLRDTIQWSYDLLDVLEQPLFRRLAVFSGGWTLEAAEAVVHADQEANAAAQSVLDGIASLLDKSLVLQIEQNSQEPRFIMLQTVREFGWECLDASGEMEATQQAHATYYLALAEEARAELGGPQLIVWLDRLDREHDNLWAALHWLLEQSKTEGSASEMALRLGAALELFWEMRGRESEGTEWLETVLQAAHPLGASSARAHALLACGNLASQRGDFTLASRCLAESQLIFEQLDDRWGRALALGALGRAELGRRNLERANAYAQEAVTELGQLSDQSHQADVRALLALIAFEQGDNKLARSRMERNLEEARTLGDTWHLARALTHLGELMRFEGQYMQAQRLYEEALQYFQQVENANMVAMILGNLGEVVRIQGDLHRALALELESVQTWQRFLGSQEHLYGGMTSLGGLLLELGETELAARLYGAAEAFSRRQGVHMARTDQASYDRDLLTFWSQADKEDLQAAWEEGRRLSLGQAVAQVEMFHQAIQASQPAEVPASTSSSSPTSSTYPADLTAREVEVLRLMAEGLTNKQIAQQLVISPKTVSRHLESLFSKLGVTSRAAATRFAVAHHLA